MKKINKKPDLEYLSNFEKKYKIDLWKLAINERIFYRFNRLYKFKTDEILLILEQECKFFESVLDEVKPDVILGYEPALHHQKIFYELCNARGIQVLGLYIARVGNKCIIAQNGETFDFTGKLEDIEGKDRSFNDLLKYKKSFDYSNLVEKETKSANTSLAEKIKAISDFILKSNPNNETTHYSYYGRKKYRVLIDSMKFELKKYFRRKFIDKNLETNIDLKKQFIFMPLGLDEELNLLHHAPFYTNQIELIRHVAKSTPIEYSLYVKEHPAGAFRGWRSIREYKEIMDIPNVFLIHPTTNSEQLYQNCSLVVSPRGTSSFDAVFYKKPSIVFGNIAFSILSMVHKVKSLEELPNLIKDALRKPIESSDLDKYVNFIEQNSVGFDILEFENLRNRYFYSGRMLSDIEIPQLKMKSFLEENQAKFEPVVLKYINKIN